MRSEDHTFPTQLRDAIGDAFDHHIPVMISTGRSQAQALAFAQDCGLVDIAKAHGQPAYVMSGLGTTVTDATTGKIVMEHHLNPDVAAKLIDTIESQQLPATVGTAKDNFWNPDLGYAKKIREGLADRPTVDSFAPLAGEATIVRVYGKDGAHAIAKVAKDLDVTAIEHPDKEGRENRMYEAILPRGVDKGTTLAGLLDTLHIDRSTAMAFGNSQFDESMFRVVGQSVAVANATPDVQSLAKFHTLSSDQGGVAIAIWNAVHSE